MKTNPRQHISGGSHLEEEGPRALVVEPAVGVGEAVAPQAVPPHYGQSGTFICCVR